MATSKFLRPSLEGTDSTYIPLPTEDVTDSSIDATPLGTDSLFCWDFVERDWFQYITACVIILNITIVVLESDDPRKDADFFVVDNLILVFYIIELACRSCHYGTSLLLGQNTAVLWNLLDIVVVAAGVTDEWLLPMLPVQPGSFIFIVVQVLRFGRLFRALKIIRLFLQTDLSWAESSRFQSFTGIVIIFNALVMGCEVDYKWSGWGYIEQVLLSIYVFELFVRLKAHGYNFFNSSNSDFLWNLLDFVIVVSSVIDSWFVALIQLAARSLSVNSRRGTHGDENVSLSKAMLLLRMVRLMRILRLVKLVKSVRPLYVLVTGVLAAVQGVVWVLVLTVVVLYAGGILATSVIGKGYMFPTDEQIPEEVLLPFKTVPMSMFTLFRVMSGATSDEQEHALDSLMEKLPTIRFAFVFFMITSSWTLLSILTAVVSENMITTTGEQHEEMKLAAFEEDRDLHIQNLKDLFSEIEHSGDGTVNTTAIEDFLSDRENALKTARFCRVPVRSVKEVMSTVNYGLDDDMVNMDHFVEALVDVGTPVTEKSVMKLEARLRFIQESIHDLLVTSSAPQRADIESRRRSRRQSFRLDSSTGMDGGRSTSISFGRSRSLTDIQDSLTPSPTSPPLSETHFVTDPSHCNYRQVTFQSEGSDCSSLIDTKKPLERFDNVVSNSSCANERNLLQEIDSRFKTLKEAVRTTVVEEISSLFKIRSEENNRNTHANHAGPYEHAESVITNANSHILKPNHRMIDAGAAQDNTSACMADGRDLASNALHNLVSKIKLLIDDAWMEVNSDSHGGAETHRPTCTAHAEEPLDVELDNPMRSEFAQHHTKADAQEAIWFLPKMLNGVSVVVHVQGNVFRVDNSWLSSDADGINYFMNKTMEEVGRGPIAPWGSTVEGVDDGDGWIRLVQGVGESCLHYATTGTPELMSDATGSLPVVE